MGPGWGLVSFNLLIHTAHLTNVCLFWRMCRRKPQGMPHPRVLNSPASILSPPSLLPFFPPFSPSISFPQVILQEEKAQVRIWTTRVSLPGSPLPPKSGPGFSPSTPRHLPCMPSQLSASQWPHGSPGPARVVAPASASLPASLAVELSAPSLVPGPC